MHIILWIYGVCAQTNYIMSDTLDMWVSVSSPLSLSSLSSARHESSTLQQKSTEMINSHQHIRCYINKQIKTVKITHFPSVLHLDLGGQEQSCVLCAICRGQLFAWFIASLQAPTFNLSGLPKMDQHSHFHHSHLRSSLPHLSFLHFNLSHSFSHAQLFWLLTDNKYDFLDGRLFIQCNLLRCSVIGSAVSKQCNHTIQVIFTFTQPFYTLWCSTKIGPRVSLTISLFHTLRREADTHTGWLWSAPCSPWCGWCSSVFESSPWEPLPAPILAVSGTRSPPACTAPTHTHKVTFVMKAWLFAFGFIANESQVFPG